jgi:uncharacterized protein YbjT (DUF2867 family)
MMRLLVLGATGFVGRIVVRLALDDPRVSEVVAPTRRPLDTHPRLTNPIVNLDALDEHATWWRVDCVISALGSTRSQTPSEADYEKIEVDYPMAVAKLARDQGAQSFAFISSLGASASAKSFYLRTKARAEESLQTIGFPSLTILRPSGIIGPRQPRRIGEEFILGLIRIMGPILPKRWRVVTGSQVASALIEAALGSSPGFHVVQSEDLHIPTKN